MQKWRSWETASEAEWGLAIEREAVIRPLAERQRLSVGLVEDAVQHLGISRSVLYDLVRRYRRRPQTSSSGNRRSRKAFAGEAVIYEAFGCGAVAFREVLSSRGPSKKGRRNPL